MTRIKINEVLRVQQGTTVRTLDYYRFCRHILGYDKMGPEHKRWQKQLYDAVNKQGLHKLVFLKPRGTYKTTFYTVGLPLWLHLGNPNLRILIANSVGENAKRFLSETTGHYLRNPKLKELYELMGYPDVPVDPHSATTTSLKLTNATKITKEPSMSITGYGSSIVSQHYDVIIVDDLCDRADRESLAVREGKKHWFADLASLLEPDGLLLIIGTRWHYDDVYAHIINELNPKHSALDKYHVEVESCYITNDEGEQVPAFPRILSEEKIQELKIDKTLPEFCSNYLNDPLPADAQVFQRSDFTFFDYEFYKNEYDRGNMTLYGFCDPALGTHKGDFSAIVIAGVDRNGLIYIMDAMIERMTPNTTKEMIIQYLENYKFVAFGIENNGFQQMFVDEVKAEAQKKRLYSPIIGIPHSTNKIGRIESIQPLTCGTHTRPATVQFRSDADIHYPELITQLIRFPIAAHDDAPDALAGVIELIKDKSLSMSSQSLFLVGVGI
jgi:predicted phage terminase large subunit-like protein